MESKIKDAKCDDCFQFLSMMGQFSDNLNRLYNEDDWDNMDILCEEDAKESGGKLSKKKKQKKKAPRKKTLTTSSAVVPHVSVAGPTEEMNGIRGGRR